MRFLVCPSGTSFWGIRNPVLNSGQNCHDHRFDVKLKRFASKLNAPNAHQALRFQGGSDGPVLTTFRHPTRPSLRCLRRRAGTRRPLPGRSLSGGPGLALRPGGNCQ